jgi:hypothetical protein
MSNKIIIRGLVSPPHFRDKIKLKKKMNKELIEKNYDDFLHYYYNCPCKGCPEGHASMWKSIVESPQWKEWEKIGMYDFAECDELGVMSAGHFQNFLKFCLTSPPPKKDKPQ